VKSLPIVSILTFHLLDKLVGFHWFSICIKCL